MINFIHRLIVLAVSFKQDVFNSYSNQQRIYLLFMSNSVDSIVALANQWLLLDKFPETKERIQSLLDNQDYATLGKLLQPRISFGTAGLRSKLDAGFSCMNELIVTQTTQGLVLYVEEQLGKGSVVIGHDARHKSRIFAEITAQIFVMRGWKVFLFGDIVPTPYVPFAINELGANCGIMITASHNPKQDNGYKLYWNNGCQIVSPHDEGISKKILENLEIWDGFDITCKNIASKTENPYDRILELYNDKIQVYSSNQESNGEIYQEKIVYTAMHGVGAKFVEEAFKSFNLPPYIPVLEQINPDPEFPTVVLPNPEEGKGALKLAIQTAERENSRLILANDPDADRLAVAERQRDGEWKIFNGNEIAILLASWSFENFKRTHSEEDVKKVVMVSSTVSSQILRSMAEKEGFIWEDTLTGFKWIGNKADEYVKKGYNFLFGFEVEIGFVVGDISLDKDGVRIAAIFNEMANFVYSQKLYLADQLENLYKKYGYFIMGTRYFFCYDPKNLERIMNSIRTFENNSYPTKIGKYEVKSVRDLTVGFDNSKPNNKPALPIDPKNQMITFTFVDGSTLTLRNSGTEPKLKWYIEVVAPTKDEALEKQKDLFETMVRVLLKPETNDLHPPSD